MRGEKKQRRNADVRGVSTAVLASHSNAFRRRFRPVLLILNARFRPPHEINKQTNQLYLTCLT